MCSSYRHTVTMGPLTGMCTCLGSFSHMLPAGRSRGPGATHTSSTQVSVCKKISSEKNQSSLEERLMLSLGQEMYKNSLEHLVATEGKEGLKQDACIDGVWRV